MVQNSLNTGAEWKQSLLRDAIKSSHNSQSVLQAHFGSDHRCCSTGDLEGKVTRRTRRGQAALKLGWFCASDHKERFTMSSEKPETHRAGLELCKAASQTI